MNKFLSILVLLLLFSVKIFAQIPAYYNDVNLNLSGLPLKEELAVKIINDSLNNGRHIFYC